MDCPGCTQENIQGADLCENCGLDLAGLDVGTWGVDPRDPILAREVRSMDLDVPVVVDSGATVEQTVAAMRAAGEGVAFVVDETGGVAGVFTERDLTLRVVVRGLRLSSTKIDDVMTCEPIAIEGRHPLAWALHRMGVDGHRRVPVVDGGTLVGVLSIRVVLLQLAGASR